ncbi:MAG: hypothetical protein K2X77_23410 [Candidatus Obscuribacterales bacterium]|jgi:hypothetical protein|nr:hypothetical protein [Candidatus Obscuribacterales bacterium]
MIDIFWLIASLSDQSKDGFCTTLFDSITVSHSSERFLNCAINQMDDRASLCDIHVSLVNS